MSPILTPGSRLVRRLIVATAALALAFIFSTSSSAQSNVPAANCVAWGCIGGEEKCMTVGAVTCWTSHN